MNLPATPPTVPKRNEKGWLLPGQASLNAGGRPATAITKLREQYGERLPELFDRLFELSHSNNETIQLQAIRELLDRMLGKPAVVVDSSHTRLDIGQMYLAALRKANETRPIVAETSASVSNVLPSGESERPETAGNGSASATS
jgi:hypothetical protein